MYDEISKGEDELKNWLSDYKQYIIDEKHQEYDPMVRRAKSILDKYRDLVPQEHKLTRDNTTYVADPYVIALAYNKMHNRSTTIIQYDDVIVITEDRIDRKGKKSIQTVCKNEGIKCERTVSLIRNESWKF